MITAAVVLPLYRQELFPDETFSIRHLQHHLKHYDCWAVAPQRLRIEQVVKDDFRVKRFPNQSLADINSYSKLLLSTSFYETFTNYDYILIYQLDCLVFSSDLEYWCQLGYDYIGAPLFREKRNPTKGFSRVGNGGLSLRRVDTFLKVLKSMSIPSWKNALFRQLPDLCDYPVPRRWVKKASVVYNARRGVNWYASNYTLNEDLFWSDRARLFYPDFKIAPIDVGLRFAFEAHPRYCFEKNNQELPFGCHAWTKWDRAFWEPFVIEEGKQNENC